MGDKLSDDRRRWSGGLVVGVASRWSASLWRRAVEAIGGSRDAANVPPALQETRAVLLGIPTLQPGHDSLATSVPVQP